VDRLIEYIAKSLVEKPDQVELRSTQIEGGRLFELKVANEDIGKVIGRDGRTVNAMRTLLSAAAQRQGTRARLEILDDRRLAAQAQAASLGGNSANAPRAPNSDGQ
jgi:predicted RNA-binding protein YlqC (UPF0109 family)